MNALDTDLIIDSTSAASPRRSRGSWFALGVAAVSLAGITALVLIAPADGPTRQMVDTPPKDGGHHSEPAEATSRRNLLFGT